MSFFINRFLYDTSSKMYRKYRQKIESLRKGMLLESNARQREAEANAIDEIAGTSGNSSEKGGYRIGLTILSRH